MRGLFCMRGPSRVCVLCVWSWRQCSNVVAVTVVVPVQALRKKGLAAADKKAGRVAAEGLLAQYIHAGSRSPSIPPPPPFILLPF